MRIELRVGALAWALGALGAVLTILWWLSPTHDLGAALAAFWRGSVGTPSALVSGTLVRAIPLAILGAGLCVAFRAGVFNVGGEGQLLLGAVAATAVGLSAGGLGPLSLALALTLAAIAGALWAGIAAFLRRRFGVLEVISTIMLNFVAANIVAYLVRGPLQEPTDTYPQTELIADAARLSRFAADSRLHGGIVLAMLVCAGAWWYLRQTAGGFRIRAVGASPAAATTTGGVDVGRVAAVALMASGGLAGLAGGIEVTGVTYALYENLTPGYGFAAIAVAILARLNPAAAIVSALLFAALETGALGMQRDAGVPSVVAQAIEGVVILATIGATSSWRRVHTVAAGSAS